MLLAQSSSQTQAREILGAINIFDKWRTASPDDILPLIIQFLLFLIGGLAVLFAVWSGFQFITSAGEPEKATTARQTLTNVVIGIVVAVLSFVAVAAVSNTVGK